MRAISLALSLLTATPLAAQSCGGPIADFKEGLIAEAV